MTVTAFAHPNIALVKYWGKSAAPGNIPATPSLSITLDGFRTETSVSIQTSEHTDHLTLNGKRCEDAKIAGFLTELRGTFDVPPLAIVSDNNFPTASGLASSASGFAALIAGINALCVLDLSIAQQSQWARRASASAARSLYEGFVSLQGPDWQAAPVAPVVHWPLQVVVAITSTAEKSVSSTVGMRASRQTSPYFDAWTNQTADDFAQAEAAVRDRDFESLANIAERSCLNMHALMLATTPPLLYWQPATLACIHTVRSLRAEGVPVFFTIDAGPQLKAVCLPEAAAQVETALQQVSGVLRTHRLGLGPGASAHQ